MLDAELYKSEIETEWIQLEPILEKYKDKFFAGYTKELFLRMYNYACTRCFGWTLPDTMMVPFADFLNHLPIDTNYDVYSKHFHMAKASVNSAKTQSSKENNKTDFSALYTKKFIEDELDPEYQALIRGQLGGKKKRPANRDQAIKNIESMMHENMKH